jgi:tRNA threonylcarbamoyladenosine biosynthesis protein TsaE
MAKIVRSLRDEAATAALGAALAEALRALAPQIAAQGLTVGLSGDLGAGKTALVRALLRQCGVTGSVKSPTYALLEPYELSSLNLYHFDFYRFKVPEEFLDRGFGEIFGPAAVCLVEWPERAGDYLPQRDLQITLQVEPIEQAPEPTEPGRKATIEAQTELGKQCLELIESPSPPARDGA